MKFAALMLLFVYQPTADTTEVAQNIELQQDVCDVRDNNCPDPPGTPSLKEIKERLDLDNADPSYDDFERLLDQIRMDIEGIDVEEEQGQCPNLSRVRNMECV